jgi:hypothetical protein
MLEGIEFSTPASPDNVQLFGKESMLLYRHPLLSVPTPPGRLSTKAGHIHSGERKAHAVLSSIHLMTSGWLQGVWAMIASFQRLNSSHNSLNRIFSAAISFSISRNLLSRLSICSLFFCQLLFAAMRLRSRNFCRLTNLSASADGAFFLRRRFLTRGELERS